MQSPFAKFVAGRKFAIETGFHPYGDEPAALFAYCDGTLFIKPHTNGEFSVILTNDEYYSRDLSEVEAILFSFAQSEGRI